MKRAARFAGFIFVLFAMFFADDVQAKTNEEKRAETRFQRWLITTGQLLEERAIMDTAEDRLREYENNYAQDHMPLLWSVDNEIKGKMEDLRTLLELADALTFLAENPASADDAADFRDKFQEVYPGYTARAGVTNFAQARKDLMEKWLNYSYGTLDANNKEAWDIKNNVAHLLSSLDNASDSSLGYTQILRARDQIKLFAAREVTNLRFDLLRQIEARARFAAERQQRKADAQAAFSKAVNEGGMRIWQQNGLAHQGY